MHSSPDAQQSVVTMREGEGEKLTRHQGGLAQAKKGQEVKGKDAFGHPHQGLWLQYFLFVARSPTHVPLFGLQSNMERGCRGGPRLRRVCTLLT